MIAFAQHLSRPYVLVLLAGALRPSPLRSQLDEPVLSLPLSADSMLLDAWIAAISATAAPCASVKIVVSSTRDAEGMRSAVNRLRDKPGRAGMNGANNGAPIGGEASGLNIEVIVDPSEWRGPAGLLYDIALAPRARIAEECVVVAAEAAVLPPPSLDPLLRLRADPTLAGVIGAGSGDRPAGLYAFGVETIRTIPSIGFYDIKEQLLPALYSNGKRVPLVRIMQDVVRLRDLDSYLYATRIATENVNGASRSPDAVISPKARVSGSCVIQRNVRVEDGAIVHDSVVMEGSQIGGGAVVARSVVGRSALVHPRSVVRSAVVAQPEMQRPIPFRNRRRGLPGARRIFQTPFASHSPARENGGAA